MKEITIVNFDFEARNLTHSNFDRSELFDLIMREGCVVLKKAFPKGQLARAVDVVHTWGQEEKLSPPQTYKDENFHSIESGISPRQKTPHLYHAYNFRNIDALPQYLFREIFPIFEKMRLFQNLLTGNSGSYTEDELGRRVRPQIIHYPSGGGMFGRHIHPFDPQKIGLILGLSRRKVDFNVGSTNFEYRDERITSENSHDIGDLIMFRFDIPHWITCIDQGDKFDLASKKGRWTAVLPFA